MQQAFYMKRILKGFQKQVWTLVLLLAGAFCFQACDSGGGGGGAPQPEPTASSPPKVTSTPVSKAYLNKPYSYTLQISDAAATVNVLSCPSWLNYDAKARTLSGTPTEADVPSPANFIAVALAVQNQKGSDAHSWYLYYLQGSLVSRTYTEPVPNYTPGHIKEVESTDLHEARNLAALYIHGHEAAKNHGIEGRGIDVAIVDSGIDKDSTYDKAVVYRALPSPPSMPDSHGTRMAGHLLRFAPEVSLYDLPLNYPYPLLFWEVVSRGINVVNLSASAQNTLGFVMAEADAMAAAIRKGVVISHSIGNLANLSHDHSAQKVWYTDQKTGKVAWSEDTLESYKFGNPFNFLPLIEGYRNLYDQPGALVQVQAVTLDNSVSDLGVVSTDKLTYSCHRSGLGIAMHDGISVLENGNGATSQAAASFSGMMTLLMEYNETLKADLTGRQIVDVVFHTATDIGAAGIDPVYGHGLVNMTKAMELMEKISKNEAPVPTVTRSSDQVASSDFNELIAMRKSLEEASLK